MEITDLAGGMLWGKCTVTLDGKQGTADQTIQVTDGSNKLYVNCATEISLSESAPKTIHFVVPCGTLSSGYSVRLFDATGKVVGILTEQKKGQAASRSQISVTEPLSSSMPGEPVNPRERGFHKDMFMDAGMYLDSRSSLAAATYLGWTLDFMNTADSLFQRRVFIESELDNNGCILYPDGAPRYRTVFVNGGKASSHGRSLTQTGRSRYITFVNNGGSYVGSCAGAFLACYGASVGVYGPNYLAIYPGPMFNSGVNKTNTGMFIPKESKLLDYYNFGGDYYIADVYHNGGGYVTQETLPKGGEILATYDLPGKKMHEQGSVWAYKENQEKGRVVTTGSHPETVSSGERRDLMAAMMLYAADGLGTTRTKAKLENGTACSDLIGDGQYHHFTMDLPNGAKNLKLDLAGPEDKYHLCLALRRGDFAWLSDADYYLVQGGAAKTMTLESLPAGTWYVSVFCDETVEVSCAVDKFECSGTLDALNGISYTLKASWN